MLLVLSYKVRKHRQGWRPMGQSAAAAPAQLKGHVPSPTFTPVPPNCDSLTPPATVLPSVPPCMGKSLHVVSLLGSPLATALAANGDATRTTAVHGHAELPRFTMLRSSQQGQEMSPGALRDTVNFTLQLNSDKKPHAPNKKAPLCLVLLVAMK